MAKSLLKAQNLSKHFPVASSAVLDLLSLLSKKSAPFIHAVDGVDLEIFTGETLGLVGESGCGKTTLGRLFLALLPPTSGKVEFEGKDIQSLLREDKKKLRRQIQIVFQDPFSSLNPRKKIRDIISLPLKFHGIVNKDEAETRVKELLDLVGLHASAMKSYPHQFSGGQKQRICIARALASKPKFIVADEPVSALDVSIQAQILNLLKDLQEMFKLTYLFITHDLGVVRHVSNRIAVMYLGKIVELADSDALFTSPMHPYTIALLSAVGDPGEEEKQQIILEGDLPSPIYPPRGCRFHTRCYSKIRGDFIKTSICEQEEPKLLDKGKGHFVACHLWG